MTMELLVRPFQGSTPVYSNLFVVTRAEVAEELSAVLEWTASTMVESVSFDPASTGSNEPACSGQEEQTCTTFEDEPTRVENPDDPEQYIMVDDVKQTTFVDKTANKKRTMRMNKDAESCSSYEKWRQEKMQECLDLNKGCGPHCEGYDGK